MLFVAQYSLVEGAMYSGKKAQCILVKSNEFKNSYPLLNRDYVATRSLRSNNYYVNFEANFSIVKTRAVVVN